MIHCTYGDNNGNFKQYAWCYIRCNPYDNFKMYTCCYKWCDGDGGDGASYLWRPFVAAHVKLHQGVVHVLGGSDCVSWWVWKLCECYSFWEWVVCVCMCVWVSEWVGERMCKLRKCNNFCKRASASASEWVSAITNVSIIASTPRKWMSLNREKFLLNTSPRLFAPFTPMLL